MAWLCAVLMVPLKLFIWSLDTKKKKLAGIKNIGGGEKRLRLNI